MASAAHQIAFVTVIFGLIVLPSLSRTAAARSVRLDPLVMCYV
jgi:hypothetical protein